MAVGKGYVVGSALFKQLDCCRLAGNGYFISAVYRDSLFCLNCCIQTVQATQSIVCFMPKGCICAVGLRFSIAVEIAGLFRLAGIAGEGVVFCGAFRLQTVFGISHACHLQDCPVNGSGFPAGNFRNGGEGFKSQQTGLHQLVACIVNLLGSQGAVQTGACRQVLCKPFVAVEEAVNGITVFPVAAFGYGRLIVLCRCAEGIAYGIVYVKLISG
ncbi:hypothetical protein Barb4_02174 [Bacteroidales bacterium Barb4]|nr:hypothetical protein Barb4_02174 [Bacteroidales bacterium Barb4]